MAKITISLVTLNLCPHISLWFFAIFADGQIIYLASKLAEVYHQHDSDEEVRATPNKTLGLAFIALSNLLLALHSNVLLSPLLGLYFLLSTAEHFLLESGGEKGTFEFLKQPSSFDFNHDTTKLKYAATKFVVSTCGLLIYGLLKLIGAINHGQSKSLLMFAVFVLLTLYRDKFEKKIATQFDPQELHFGRALLTPLIYIVFTILSVTS